MVSRRSLLSLLVTGAVVASAVIGCGGDFAPKNTVLGVRILAARADQPYARPGETVTVDVLADDGRIRAGAATPTDPMRLFWFPAPCVNPPGDQYYACYSAIEAAYPIGVDLTPALREGPRTTVTIPSNALEGAGVPLGQNERYVTAYVFVAACPGHLERIARPGNIQPNAPPLGCVSSTGQRIGADQFVVGFTRIFVFENRRNALPVLDAVTFEGKNVDPKVGVTTGVCVRDKQGQCPKVNFDSVFADAIAELDPANVNTDGQVGRETIYVDWFTSIGRFGSDRKIVFDPYVGRPKKTENEFEPPGEPQTGTVFAVLHDNRGGSSWITFPIVVR